jgi:hypothetical protein
MAATVTQQKASARMVVLLRPKEKLRLQALARKERVSAAEIIRRSLAVYEEFESEENAKLLAEMNAAIDKNLASIRSNREAIEKTRAEIDRLEASRG